VSAKKLKYTGVRVPADLMWGCKAQAAGEHLSVQEFVARVLRKYLDSVAK
jgi:predicted DNA binding CopG/RHH family protein